MRIVIAPNAFKGSLSALDAAEAIAEGVRIVAADADLVLVPIADGGDGTVDALVAATHGERRTLRVRGPLDDPVDAGYGLIDTGSTAVIEMAKAAGLARVPSMARRKGRRRRWSPSSTPRSNTTPRSSGATWASTSSGSPAPAPRAAWGPGSSPSPARGCGPAPRWSWKRCDSTIGWPARSW